MRDRVEISAVVFIGDHNVCVRNVVAATPFRVSSPKYLI
jgi:hypothetical protein